MKNKIKVIIFILLNIFLLVFLAPILITQQFNPYLKPEQQQQLEEYRKVLEEELVKPIEREIEMENFKLDAVKGLIDWLNDISSHTKRTYSVIDSPFNKMTAESSNEKYFTATADKTAIPGEYYLEIIQVAKSDILESKAIGKKLKLDAAEFTIVSGDIEKTVKFKGGNIHSLEKAINRYAKEIVRARTIKKDYINDEYVLTIEGLLTGEINKLVFYGDITPLQQIGMLFGGPALEETIEVDESEGTEEGTEEGAEEGTESSLPGRENLINANSILNLIYGNYFKDNDDVLGIQPKSLLEMDIPEGYVIKPESYLEVKVKSNVYVPEESEKEPPSESEVEAGDKQDLDVDNVGTIEEPYNDPFLPQTEVSDEDKEELDENKMYLIGLRNSQEEEHKKLGTEKKPIEQEYILLTYNLNEYYEEDEFIDRVIFFNDSADKNLIFTDLKIYSTYVEPEDEPEDEVDELQPDGNYTRRSKDAIVRYGGLDIIRESNEIDDIIQGVTLKLKKETEGEEKLIVDHDYDAVVEHLIELIDYNNVIATYIYNVTLFDKDKTAEELLSIYRGENVSDKVYKEQKLQGEAYERLLYNDREVNKVKSELREIMYSAYNTEVGMDLAMIVHIGIDNKEYEYKLQNPLLEVDEDVLRESLVDNFDAVKQLFYQDVNEDNLIDEGVAFRIGVLADKYREKRYQVGEAVYPGILYTKIEQIRSKLGIGVNKMSNNLKEELKEAKEEVEKKVGELEQQFIAMNQAQDQQNNLTNMFNQGEGEGGGG